MKMAVTKGAASSLIALSLALALVGCATDAPPPPPPPPPPAPSGPPVSLASNVSDAAAVYVDYMAVAKGMKANFTDASVVQAQLTDGSAYHPDQLARGVVAYGAIVAMQEHSFRASLRAYAADDAARAELVQRLSADPAYAAALPSASIAARRVILALSSDGQTVYNSGAGVKRAAYDVQRQKWSKEHISDPEVRLSQAKQNAVTLRSVRSDESARLLAAALTGSGLTTQATTGQSTGTYVIHGDGVSFEPTTSPAETATAGEPVSVASPAPQAVKLTAKASAASDAAVPASTFASTTNIFDRPDLFDEPYTNAVNRSLTIAALAILGEGGDNRAEFMNALMEDSIGERCFDMSKLNLYQCLSVAKPHFEDVFCLGQHVLMDTGQCLGKMSSNALSFDPVHVVKAYASAQPYIKPAPVKKAVPAKKTATSAKKRR